MSRLSGVCTLIVTPALSSGANCLSRARTTISTPGSAVPLDRRVSTSTGCGTSATSQRTVCRQALSRSLSLWSSRRMCHRHRSPTSRAAVRPRPNGCTTRAGRGSPPAVSTSASTDGARLDRVDAVDRLEGRHRGQPLLLVLLVGPHADPRLQPAFARERQPVAAGRAGGDVAVEIDRQHVADRRALVVPLGERILARRASTARRRAG